MDFLFGFFGTFNRTQWWISQLLIFPIGIFLYLISILFFVFSYGLGFTAMIGVILLTTLISFASTAKRFRDRGKSGLWTLLNFVPLGFIWIIIECGFLPGNGTSYTINSSNYDGPVSGEVQDFSQKAPKTQTTRFGSNNVIEDNNPKPLFGA